MLHINVNLSHSRCFVTLYVIIINNIQKLFRQLHQSKLHILLKTARKLKNYFREAIIIKKLM